MRNPLRRYYGRGDLHFVTFSCYRRRPLLGTRRARDRFVKILDQVRSRFGFRLIGYVVMPEHVHLLISEPKTANPSKALQVLKQKVSRELGSKPAPLKAKGAAHAKPSRPATHPSFPLNWSAPERRDSIFGSGAFMTSMYGARERCVKN
ncbi:MAG TPA: transposase [Rugosimonospora sp.]|nr:transposase [Rugosimonospora sp.]